MASSVRFTTATPVALRLRKVVVSRNGFKTIVSSPHSTPMGAKLMTPSGSLLVTMVSTITARGRRREEPKRGCCQWCFSGELHRQPAEYSSERRHRGETGPADDSHAR